MNTPLTLRLRLAALALLAEAAHLGWEALHGGIVTHHLLQRADLPGISNAWGLLVLPALGAWTAGRWPAWRDARWKVALGVLLPLVMGAALSIAFRLQWQAGTEALFFSLLLAALVLFLPVGVEYLKTGLVPRFPTLIVSAALLSFVAGVILDVVVKKHRQLFELLLTMVEEGKARDQ